MSTAHALNASSFPLRGSHLIEASAGTGKTWTIAALYVRLVLGHGEGDAAPVRQLLPQDVLVMTFTRAATRELSDRIRTRLSEAAQMFRSSEAPTEAFLLKLWHDHPAGPQREEAAHRLAMAAQAMDDAAVFTIDAWCQRMLREHAFDSGSLFDESLVGDEAALRLQAVQDYWRQQLYPMDTALVARVQKIWRDVPALEKDMRELMAAPLDEPQPGTLAEVFGMVEKPVPAVAPSTLAVAGRYILTPAVFDSIRQQPRGSGGEIQLTDGIAALIGTEKVYAFRYDGKRYDCGSKEGFLEATIDFALADPLLGPAVRVHLAKVLG
jgi:hypothetical protein